MSQKTNHLSWSYKVYDQYDRGMGWYLGAGTIVGLLLLYSFLTENYLFAVLVFMTMAVVFLRQIYTPPIIKTRIDTLGVLVDDERYPFTQIKEFWVIDTADGKSRLYLRQASGLHGLLMIPIEGISSDDVREYMSPHVPENTEFTSEPLDEKLSRVLKL